MAKVIKISEPIQQQSPITAYLARLDKARAERAIKKYNDQQKTKKII